MPLEPIVFPITGNLRAVAWNADDNARAVIIYFQAREIKEAVSFRVTTATPIISTWWRMPQLQGGQWLSLVKSEEKNHFAIALSSLPGSPGLEFLDEPFIIGLEIEVEDDPRRHILRADIWDKAGGEPQIVYIEFTGVT